MKGRELFDVFNQEAAALVADRYSADKWEQLKLVERDLFKRVAARLNSAMWLRKDKPKEGV